MKKSKITAKDICSQAILHDNFRCILLIEQDTKWYLYHLCEQKSGLEVYPCNSKNAVFIYVASLFQGMNVNVLVFDIKLLTSKYAQQISGRVCYLNSNESEIEYNEDSISNGT